MGSRQLVLGMRFGASARGSRGGRRACLPELQGLIVGRHTVVVRAPAATHTTLEIARAWAATSPKAWEYEVSAPSRCLLPVSAKLCRRHCRKNAGSDRSLSRGREAFTIPYIDPTLQLVGVDHQV